MTVIVATLPGILIARFSRLVRFDDRLMKLALAAIGGRSRWFWRQLFSASPRIHAC